MIPSCVFILLAASVACYAYNMPFIPAGVSFWVRTNFGKRSLNGFSELSDIKKWFYWLGSDKRKRANLSRTRTLWILCIRSIHKETPEMDTVLVSRQPGSELDEVLQKVILGVDAKTIKIASILAKIIR